MIKNIITAGLVLTALLFILLGCVSTTQPPGVPEEKLAWWPSKALPQPHDDPWPERKGKWWWPTDPGDEPAELWGNRGYVYVLRYSKEEEEYARLPLGLKSVEALVLPDVNFEFDKSSLTPEAQKILMGVVEKLKKYPEAMLTLEGHTCSIGTEKYNIGLGMRRATSVKNFLVQQGIDLSRLKAISYGESRPKYVERAREDFRGNRRVEFKVEMPKK